MTSKKNRRSYRLPDGKYTTDVRRMVTAWRKVYIPLQKFLGASGVGFDPDVTYFFNQPVHRGSASLPLPLWFIQKINPLLPKGK